jgi:hypothetical protein|nr:MAG TPA: hypothetical protein [Caudoviricetes sp.]
MERQLYREVWKGPGTELIEVPEEEVKAAKEKRKYKNRQILAYLRVFTSPQ